MPPSVRAEGLKSNSKQRMVQGPNWEVKPSGKTLSTSSPWGGETLSLPVGKKALG